MAFSPRNKMLNYWRNCCWCQVICITNATAGEYSIASVSATFYARAASIVRKSTARGTVWDCMTYIPLSKTSRPCDDQCHLPDHIRNYVICKPKYSYICTYMRTHMCAYIHETYIHKYIHTCMHICILTYVRTNIHTHTYIHTCIHTYTYIQGVTRGICQTSGGCSLC
jgi:hypothetical protein